MGNLTRDPELRSTPSGQQVASFAVATNRTWNDPSGERKEAVEFHEVVAWGKLGELAAQYLSKGRKVMVVGRLQTQSWEKDGVKQRRTEIVAADINFLDAPGAAAATAGADSDAPAPKPSSKKSDDIVIEDLDDAAKVDLDTIPF
jgi:single-strand DNA-binding protein